MVSRSNYAAITLIMCVVLLMFQLTGMSESVLFNTGENIYAEKAVTEEYAAQAMERYERQSETLLVGSGNGADVGLVGDREDAYLTAGRNWCSAQKKTYCYYADLAAAAADTDGPGFLLVPGESLDAADAEAIRALTEQSRNVAVSGLPDSRLLRESKELRRSLGILEMEGDITVDGFKLFSGLILGGETVYKEYEQEMPYAKLDHSVTAYAVAYSETDEELLLMENEDLPAIIWRYAPNRGKVYVVNGDYLTGQMGAGLLTGFAADSEEVYVYPVVNAQVSVAENYPLLADENDDFMEDEYGQPSSLVFRDILWPSIVSIFYDTDDVMTTTAAFRLDYGQDEELEPSLIQYYYEQITKESGEMGLSGYQVSDITLKEKLEQDVEFLEETLPGYEIGTFGAGGLSEEDYASLVGEGGILEDVHTVLTDYDGDGTSAFFSYLDNGALQMPLYMDGSVMQDEDDFRSRCLQTAYGYYGTAVDMARVVYPQSEDDMWNEVSNEWGRNYRPFRVPFECFEKLSATEADRRVRNYLALDYEAETAGNTIRLSVDAIDGESYFVVRLHGNDIARITGGSFEEIEDGWYLITAEKPEVELVLEQTDQAYYYIGEF